MFTDQVVVVTGGSRGIGRATAELFALRGARVAVAARDLQACQEVADEMSAAGHVAAAFHLDVTDESTVAALYRDVAARFGRVDICINNAGAVLRDDTTPPATSVDTWSQTIAINLTGTFLCLKHQLPQLIDGDGGVIVNVSGTAALLGSATPQIAYDAAKAGVLSLTRDVAVAHAQDGIRCNAVCPGPIEGEMIAGLLGDETALTDRLTHIPVARFGTAAEVAEAIAYLASPNAGWTTAVSLPVDGGITSAYNTHPRTALRG